MVATKVYDLGVGGSTPPPATIAQVGAFVFSLSCFLFCAIPPRRHLCVDKAGSDLSLIGSGSSDVILLHSSIAQLVEHAAVNRRVVGSSPT